MMGTWMISSVAASALIGVAAVLAEGALLRRSGPTRWAWLGALTASIALALQAALRSAPAPASAPGSAGAVPSPDLLALLAGGGSAPGLLARLDPWLGPLWLGASALLVAAFAGGMLRLAWRARRWRPATVAGARVLVSDHFGPAVLGLPAPQVVLPRWALALPDARIRMVVLHEEEHRRARDPQTLLAGTLAVLAMPWNPVLWWQLHRLRAAVEVDCDARVVRRGVPVTAYGRLLLDLGARTRALPLPVAALARPRSLLERRLTTMLRGVERGGRGRLVATVGGVTVLVALACETPAPLGVDEPPAGVAATAGANGEAAAAAGVVSQLRTRSAGALYRLDGAWVDDLPATVSVEAIDRVEVLKGPAAEAMFGPKAAGGVVSVYTKDPGSAAGEMRFRAPAPEAGTVGARLEGAEGGTHTYRVREPGGGTSTIRVREVAPAPGGAPSEAAANQAATDDAMGQADVFLDGVRFEGPLARIDPSTIARVEVVKGRGSRRDAIHVTSKEAATRR